MSNTKTAAAKPMPKMYTATCDYCSISKVKCGRGQPQCLRCIQSGVECHYSESRRTGKAKRILANQSSARQQESSTCSSSPEYATPRSAANGSDELSDQCLGDHVFHQGLPNGFTQNNYTPTSMPSPHLYPTRSHGSSGTDVASYHNNSSESLSNFQNFNLEGLEATLGSMDTASMQSHGFTMGFNLADGHHSLLESSAGFNTAPESCKKKALAALESMHTPAQCCSATTNDERHNLTLPTVDACLNTNCTAKDTVSQILRCPCVDSDWSLLLLLTLVVHRTVDSYSTILKKIQSPRSTSEDDEDSLDDYFDTESVQSAAPFTLDVPMAVGGYVLDEMAKNKVVACLIRTEIEELGKLIEKLARKRDDQSMQGFGQASFRGLIQSLVSIREKALEMDD